MDKKQLGVGATLILVTMLVTFLVTSSLYTNTLVTNVVSADGFPPVGYMTIKLKRAGTDEWTTILDRDPNTITHIGLQMVRDQLGWANGTAESGSKGGGLEQNITKFMSLSVEDPALSGANYGKLPNEITANNLTRTSGSGEFDPIVSSVNYSAYRVVFTFTASGTQAVNYSGLHWNPVSAKDMTMFAYNSFTTTTLYANDQLQITWEIDID